MKTPVLIVVCASAAVLCTLPALYIFLAYQTRKERKSWVVDYDKAVKRLEAEQQRNPRPRSPAIPGGSYSSEERGRARTRDPARPAYVEDPQAAPPRPLRSPRPLRRKGPLRPTAPGSSGHRRSSSSSERRRRRGEEASDDGDGQGVVPQMLDLNLNYI